MSIRIAVVLLLCLRAASSANAWQQAGTRLQASRTQYSSRKATYQAFVLLPRHWLCAGQSLAPQHATLPGRAGRALLRQDALLPQSWLDIFKRATVTNAPAPTAAATSAEAAETMLPPTVTIPADFHLESAVVDPATDPDTFAGLFKNVPHRGGGFAEIEASAEHQPEAGDTSDVLESGQMLQKIQAESLPVIHDSSSSKPASKDQPATATNSKGASAPPTAPAPVASATTPTTKPASSSSTAEQQGAEAALPAKPAAEEVALIPTDPYASAAAITVVPYTGGGGKYSEAAMQAFLNTAGGMAAFRDKHGKMEVAAGQQEPPTGSSKLSSGAIAGLVIGLSAIGGCVVWYVAARYRSGRRPAAAGLRKQQQCSSADAEVDVAGSDGMVTPRSTGPRAAGTAGASGAFQPARSSGRFSSETTRQG